MKTIELSVGKQVQRKGSTVVWTINGHNNMALPEGQTFGALTVDLGIEGATEIHLRCIPKNRTIPMYEWVTVENLNKNWREV